MKLLIITQKVDENDDILGFFHQWVEEFAKQAEKVIVIAQFVGEYNFPKNAKVFSLGKESMRKAHYECAHANIIRNLQHLHKIYRLALYLYRFYKYIWRERKNYDSVFVHMNPEYVVLGGLFWKLWGKRVGLWYVHKKVNLMLWLAEKFVEKIFTASMESCRLKSNKIVVVGHGIDIQKFEIRNPQPRRAEARQAKFETNPKSKIQNPKFKIITAGRITPVKNYEILIEAAKILKDKRLNFEIRIAGAPVLEKDNVYSEKLKNLVSEKNLGDKITFVGAILYKDIAEFYQGGDLFVNFSDTGSLDKAVLEAMAAGLLVLTSNEAFKNILPEKYFTGKNQEEISEKIITLCKADSDLALRDYVVKNHSLNQLIAKLILLI